MEFHGETVYRINTYSKLYCYILDMNIWAPQSNTQLVIKLYLGINLTKHVQESHAESYLALIKEIKDTNTWRDTPYS